MERIICTKSNLKRALKIFTTNIQNVKFVIVLEV